VTDPSAWLAQVRQLEARGELLLAYDTALHGLEEHPGDLRLRHRAVLNLAKAGATANAEAEFVRLGLHGVDDADVAALHARIAKDRALDACGAERLALLARAADLYQASYRRSGDYYPGVNVASLRLLAGQPEAAVRTAREVLALCRTKTASDEDAYYRPASEAEAALVLGDTEGARQALSRAAKAGIDLAARAATRRQLRMICAARQIADDLLDPLAPPTVIHYTGHMIAAPGAHGRFPAAQEAAVAAQIAPRLERHRVGFGYGALASGGDILFAEALLARGAELHVVLPFTRDEFIDTSVRRAGEGWVARFDACLQRASTVTYATEDSYLGHDWVFAYGSIVAMGLAVLRARFLDADVLQLAVWDGVETQGMAGTGYDVRTWRDAGRPREVIASGASADRPAPAATAVPMDGGQRELKAMLFGDVRGFSKLTDAQIPAFVSQMLSAVGNVLSGYGERVLYRNTWGDGLFVVLDDAPAAAQCALDLQAAMAAIDLHACRLPETLALRLGGHFGPVFEATDPVLHVTNYFGTHVSRTARIEPVTPPGEVYVTEQFAARLALQPNGYVCDYVGRIPAAKSYGTMRMYHLRAPRGNKS
jgi:class 3 adenylate cyclase